MKRFCRSGWGLRGIRACVVLLALVSSCGDDAERRAVMPAKLVPTDVVRVGAAGSEHGPWSLFDRDTALGWAPELDDRGIAQVEVRFGRHAVLTHLKVFGPSPYDLTVRNELGHAVEGLERVHLGELGSGWNLLPVGGSHAYDSLVLELSPTTTGGEAAEHDPTPIAEVEFWSLDAMQRPVDPHQLQGNTDTSAPPSAEVSLAEPEQLALTAQDSESMGDTEQACGSMQFSLSHDPSSYQRAWLSYSIHGVARPFALTRALNAGAMRRGRWLTGLAAEAGATGERIVEPIDPTLLETGDNLYHFCLPGEVGGEVVVSNARFIGELDVGSNLVEWMAAGPLDGTPTEGAMELLQPTNDRPRSLHAGERLLIGLDRWVSPDALLINSSTDGWALDCLDEAGEGDALPISPARTEDGFTLFRIDDASASCAGLALRPTAAAGGAVSYLSVVGSGARRRLDWPKMTLASPAEHFGKVAWIDGWANAPSDVVGAVSIEIDTLDVGTKRGVFGQLLTRLHDDSEAWPVQVTARFKDGTSLSRTYVLERNREFDLEPPGGGGPSTTQDAERYGEPGETETATVDGSTDVSIRLGTDVGVDIPAGAVTASIEVSVKHLLPTEVPPLDPGMVNVTAPTANGYEFLPHGQQFNEPVELLLPYDEALLPQGYIARDVHSYYYDTEISRWRKLARSKLDEQAGTVRSLSDHFTVMINAVVVAPEHPQLRQFNPNEIRGIQAADPGQRISLIEPPRPTSRGDATLSYFFDLPPGRLGLAPSLALTYNSSGGNGWVGLGWDLPLRAITVDTRWGAARYHPTEETESYLLEGAQLTPLAHRVVKNRSDDTTLIGGETVKIFLARVEGEFRKIIRHGTQPTNYWWEVIDKTGLRLFYGSTPEAGTPLVDATLQTDGGQVFAWALTEVRDRHGNTIRYHHKRASHMGFVFGTVPGSELYLERISYTHEAGSGSAPYEVVFAREAGRPDVVIDGRGGLKRVTADLLRRIEVRYQGQQVRAWELDYVVGAFRKSLLSAIRQFGAGNTPFVGNAHTFTYFDEIRSDAVSYDGFEAPVAWNVRSDSTGGLDLPGPVEDFLGSGEATVLGGSGSDRVGIHAYIGFNPSSPTKQNSVGGKVGGSHAWGSTHATFVDINGDGLPDKVFDAPGGIAYRLNESGPTGGPQFSNDLLHAQGLNSLGSHSSTTLSVGAEAYPLTFNVMFNYGLTFSIEDAYLSDVNGDGLPDLVDGGAVRFNTGSSVGGQQFDTTSASTPLPITLGTVDQAGLLPDYSELEQERDKQFPPIDTVRIWTPPYSGTVDITGAVHLEKANDKADGVRVAIQQADVELWHADIGPTDTSDKTPTGVSGIDVTAFEPIYFRVSTGSDARDDLVAWDPVVQYVGGSALRDANGLNERRFRASSDFVLGGRSDAFAQLPFAGEIHLQGAVSKQRTSDEVDFEIRH